MVFVTLCNLCHEATCSCPGAGGWAAQGSGAAQGWGALKRLLSNKYHSSSSPDLTSCDQGELEKPQGPGRSVFGVRLPGRTDPYFFLIVVKSTSHDPYLLSTSKCSGHHCYL